MPAGHNNSPPLPSQRPDLLTFPRFAAALAALLFLTFPQVFAGFETFAHNDAGRFAYPVAFYFRESFWRGELPFWNPYNNCGTPFLAQWNTMTLYPLSLFYLLLPLSWGFGIFSLGHMYIAGLGMFWYTRRKVGSGLAAAVAGAVFAFNGLTWSGLMWPHILAALAWMPWFLGAFELAWQRVVLMSPWRLLWAQFKC